MTLYYRDIAPLNSLLKIIVQFCIIIQYIINRGGVELKSNVYFDVHNNLTVHLSQNNIYLYFILFYFTLEGN